MNASKVRLSNALIYWLFLRVGLLSQIYLGFHLTGIDFDAGLQKIDSRVDALIL